MDLRGVAIYCRISSDRLDTRAGVERQEAACRLFAEARGWGPVTVFVDNSVSAFGDQPRPAYERLLGALRESCFHAVLAWDADRLHRSVLELEHFIELLASVGATFYTVTGGSSDLHTATGRMQARMKGTIAHYEVEHRSERVVAAAAASAAAGRFRGRRPYGFDLNRDVMGRPLRDGLLTLVPREAAVVRRMVAQVLDDGASPYRICVELNADGIPAPGGGRWRTATVRYVLTNPVLAGLTVHRKQVVGRGRWEPLVSIEAHQALCERLRPRTRRNPSPRGIADERGRAFPLSGALLRCGRCGQRMSSGYRYGAGHDPRPIYRCGVGPDYDGCGRVSIAGRQLEWIVVAHAMQRLTTANLTSGGLNPAAGGNAEVRIAELLLDGQLAVDAWRQLDAVAQPGGPRAIDGLIEAFQRRPASWQCDRLGRLLNRVVVRPSSANGGRFDPARIVLHWADGAVTRGAEPLHPLSSASAGGRLAGIDQDSVAGQHVEFRPGSFGPEVDDDLVARLYMTGLTQALVAERLGLGVSTVSRSLRRSGTPIRPAARKLTVADDKALLAAFAWSTRAELAERFGVAPATVDRALRRARQTL